MAVAVWLRRTSQRYINQYLAPTLAVEDAANAYLRGGEVLYPFAEANAAGEDFEDDEEIDERRLGL